MAFSFRDDYPILQPGATIDESLTSAAFGVAQPVLPKIVGSWAENFGPFAAATATSSVVYIAPYPVVVIGFVLRFGTASSSGTVNLEKTPSGTAVGSGTVLLTGTVSTAGT